MSNPPPETPRSEQRDGQPRPAGVPVEEEASTKHIDENRGSFHGFGPRVIRVIEIVLAVAGVVAVAFALKMWQESEIEKAVQKALSDEVILRRIATQAQPVLLFDENGGFISDSGGLAYIDRIVIEERKDSFPTKLLVKPKRLLAQPPLLSTVDGILLEYGTRRREGMDWEYAITNYVIQGVAWDSKSCRFRMEILRNP